MKVNKKNLQKEYEKKAKQYLTSNEKLNKLVIDAVIMINKLDKSPKLEKVWDNLLLTFSLLNDWIDETYRDISKSSMVLIIISLLYLLNPLDVIPDIIPIIGYIDDVAVIAFILKQVNEELAHYKQWSIDHKK